MKKRLFKLVSTMMIGAMILTGCGAEKGNDAAGTAGASGEITVVSREDGSGTRGAFVELLGIEQKDANGNKVDMTTLDAKITNSTSVMMTTIEGDVNAIGYISLGSLNETVTAVSVEGVEATAENVANGTYAVQRPFNIAVKENVSEAAQDFINFILSAEGQAIVEKSGYIAVGEQPAYEPANVSGKVVVAGSSSVTPVMEKLKEAYVALNPNIEIEVQQNDSSTGMQYTIDGLCDIGMASRELKDSETEAGLMPTVIAQDGIAVIVNNESGMTDLSAEQIMNIYTGEVTTWEELN